MSIRNSSAQILTLGLLGLFLVLPGCDDSPTEPNEPDAGFTVVWEHGFNVGTVGWIGNETAGPSGWCGSISQHDDGSGPVAPAEGPGYATVVHGPCNEYWTGNGIPSSGPYGPFGGYSSAWPSGGFNTELDIYLDPAWDAGAEGSVFTFSVSIDLLDKQFPNNFRYFFTPVVKDGDELSVAGAPITEAGWYTFRHTFRDEDGSLAVDFELLRNGETVASQEITTTALSEEATSSFSSSNVGTGYHWFVAISSGRQLPIDHQRLLYTQ